MKFGHLGIWEGYVTHLTSRLGAHPRPTKSPSRAQLDRLPSSSKRCKLMRLTDEFRITLVNVASWMACHSNGIGNIARRQPPQTGSKQDANSEQTTSSLLLDAGG